MMCIVCPIKYARGCILHDDVIKWKHFSRYRPFVRWIPHQRPVTRRFDVFFDLRPNKRLSKQWWGCWFETPSCPLWSHCNVVLLFCNQFYSWSLGLCSKQNETRTLYSGTYYTKPHTISLCEMQHLWTQFSVSLIIYIVVKGARKIKCFAIARKHRYNWLLALKLMGI